MRWYQRVGAGLWLFFGFGVFYMLPNRFQFVPPVLAPKSWFDDLIPLQAAWVWPYVLTYPVVAMPVFRLERRVIYGALLPAFYTVLILGAVCFLGYPTTLDRFNYPIVQDQSVSAWALGFVRDQDQPTNCIPSQHITMTALCTWVLWKWDTRAPLWFRTVWTWSAFLLISYSTLATKQHYLIDVVTGLMMGLFGIWLFEQLRRGTYRLPLFARFEDSPERVPPAAAEIG